MSEAIESVVPIVLQGQKGETKGSVSTKAVPKDVAFRKGALIWAGCWLAAVLTIPIPIVHFIAPPLLLLAGPIVGIAVIKIFGGAVDITAGGGACPDCGKPITLGPCAERWPMDLPCPHCGVRLYINKT